MNFQDHKERVPEQGVKDQQMISMSSQCYVLLEKYKLRTNLIAINTPKDLIDYNYKYLEERMVDRYDRIYESIKQGIDKLQASFVIAQASTLRTLNNIIRNYRRRVGTLSNEPLSHFKYNRYDKQQKMLLQSIIYNDKENYLQVKSFKKQLQRNIELGVKQIEEKYRQNQKIKENQNFIFDVIDKTQCYTYKYYENFQRSMLTTVHTLEAQFEKLNAYLSVWENVGSTKAYEVRSAKQIQYQQKIFESDRSRRFFEEQSEEQLEELMKNSPQYSAQREEYRKRLAQVKRYNSEKQKKLENVGKMYSKRRQRAGILVNKNKEVNVLEWVINLENTKVPYSHQDEFKSYRADNDQTDYRLTLHQIQKPMKTIQEIKAHLEKYRQGKTLNFQWWYDRFGKDGTFDLITSQSQQIQKRLQFQFIRQNQLQNTDDRRKRELLQKQNYQMRESERKENLHIGYLHIHDKTELEWLIERSYNTQYIPGMLGQDSSDLSFSDEEISEKGELPRERPKNLVIIQKEEQVKMPLQIQTQKNSILKQKEHQENLQEHSQQQQSEHSEYQENMPIEEQLIKIYFKEYSKKMLRKQSEPQYRKTQFLYYRQIKDIAWPILQKYLDYENIFIYTSKTIFYINKIFSASKQKIKCSVYTIQQQQQQDDEQWQQAIKQQIRQCYKDCPLVTVIFHPIYLQNKNVTIFMIGLLITLIHQGKMPEDYELKDYIKEGKSIVQDFNKYFLSRDVIAPRTNVLPSKQQKEKKEDKQKHEVSSTLTTPIPKSQNERVTAILPKVQEQQAKQQQTFEYKMIHEQRQLKRSNSREFLNKFQIEIQQMENRQQSQQENQDEQYL